MDKSNVLYGICIQKVKITSENYSYRFSCTSLMNNSRCFVISVTSVTSWNLITRSCSHFGRDVAIQCQEARIANFVGIS